jgi:uncharacterized protein (TIGR03545 family)
MSTAPATDAKPTTPQKPIKTGWIRWSGLGILAILALLIFLAGYYGLSAVVKQQLEQRASQLWGAKVEIGSVNFGLAPLGVTLRNIALTDPDKPMENLVVIRQLRGDLNLYHLVVGRTVIEHALVDGIALHQPRKTSGALPKQTEGTVKPEAKPAEEEAKQLAKKALSSLQGGLPNPEDLVKKEPLLTQQAAEKVQQDYEALQQTWEELQRHLPTDDKLKDYQRQFKALTKDVPKDIIAIQKRQLQFELLKKQVELDKREIERGQKKLRAQIQQLQADLKALKAAPQQDFKRLQSKYTLDEKGLSNLTALLFGPKVQGWLETAQNAYDKAQPLIEKFQQSEAEKAAEEAEKKQRQRSLGREVVFKEYDPEPDFIVHLARLSAQMDRAKWLTEVRDLNFEHPQFGKPTTFKSMWQPDAQPNPLLVQGGFNHILPQQPLDKAQAVWKQYQVKDWALIKDDRMTIKMPKAVADFEGEARLLLNPKTQRLDQVASQFHINYQQVQFDLSDSKAKEVKEYLAPGFAEIDHFKVKGKVNGLLWAPKVEVSSDLDRHLQNAYQNLMQQRIQAAKAQLRHYLNEQAQKQLQPVEKQLQDYLGKDVKLNQDISQLQKILESKFNERLEREKQRLIDEAKRKVQAEVDKRKAQLEAKKRELEKKAEAEKKKQQQKLEQQVQDKLKGLIKF